MSLEAARTLFEKNRRILGNLENPDPVLVNLNDGLLELVDAEMQQIYDLAKRIQFKADGDINFLLNQ